MDLLYEVVVVLARLLCFGVGAPFSMALGHTVCKLSDSGTDPTARDYRTLAYMLALSLLFMFVGAYL